jgi:hypothetical protein
MRPIGASATASQRGLATGEAKHGFMSSFETGRLEKLARPLAASQHNLHNMEYEFR